MIERGLVAFAWLTLRLVKMERVVHNVIIIITMIVSADGYLTTITVLIVEINSYDFENEDKF